MHPAPLRIPLGLELALPRAALFPHGGSKWYLSLKCLSVLTCPRLGSLVPSSLVEGAAGGPRSEKLGNKPAAYFCLYAAGPGASCHGLPLLWLLPLHPLYPEPCTLHHALPRLSSCVAAGCGPSAG